MEKYALRTNKEFYVVPLWVVWLSDSPERLTYHCLLWHESDCITTERKSCLLTKFLGPKHFGYLSGNIVRTLTQNSSWYSKMCGIHVLLHSKSYTQREQTPSLVGISQYQIIPASISRLPLFETHDRRKWCQIRYQLNNTRILLIKN